MSLKRRLREQRRQTEREQAPLVVDDEDVMIEADAETDDDEGFDEQVEESADDAGDDDDATHSSDGDDDPFEVLKRQYAELENRHKADRLRFEEAERRRIQTENQVKQYQRSEVDHQKTIIDQAISNVEQSIDRAKNTYVNARQNGDYEAEIEAQRAIARAESELMRLHEGKDHLTIQQRQPSREDQIEAYIGQFSPDTQRWARSNKADLFSGNGENIQKAVSAHQLAVQEGITPDTDEYFAFLDNEMGYTRKSPSNESRQKPQKPRAVQYSAPVQRSGTPTSSSPAHRLTAQEREFADGLGMTYREYAEYKKNSGNSGRIETGRRRYVE